MVAKIRKIAECSKYFHEIIRLPLMISVFLVFPIPYGTAKIWREFHRTHAISFMQL